MKLKRNTNIPAFLQAVQKCREDVLFITPEGDKLNLKSTLSQFVFTTVIAGNLQRPEGDVQLTHPKDITALKDFLSE